MNECSTNIFRVCLACTFAKNNYENRLSTGCKPMQVGVQVPSSRAESRRALSQAVENLGNFNKITRFLIHYVLFSQRASALWYNRVIAHKTKLVQL